MLLEEKPFSSWGEGEEEITDFYSVEMQPGKLFNVGKNAWHCCVLSRDATILLVENQDTGKDNTDYIALEPSQKERLVEISGTLIKEWQK